MLSLCLGSICNSFNRRLTQGNTMFFLKGIDIFGRITAVFTKGVNFFVTSGLLLCIPSPFGKGFNTPQNQTLLLKSNFFLFRVEPYSQGRLKILTIFELPRLHVYIFLLNQCSSRWRNFFPFREPDLKWIQIPGTLQFC